MIGLQLGVNGEKGLAGIVWYLYDGPGYWLLALFCSFFQKQTSHQVEVIFDFPFFVSCGLAVTHACQRTARRFGLFFPSRSVLHPGSDACLFSKTETISKFENIIVF